MTERAHAPGAQHVRALAAQLERHPRLVALAVGMLLAIAAALAWELATRMSPQPPRRSAQDAGAEITAQFAVGSRPMSDLSAGVRLHGEVAFGRHPGQPVVYFKSDAGQRLRATPQPGTAGFTTAAFQATFLREARAPFVADVGLRIEQAPQGPHGGQNVQAEKYAVFSRAGKPFLTVRLTR